MPRPLKVACVVPYPTGRAGGQRFRFEQWFALLPPDQVTVDYRPLWTDADYQLMYRQGMVGRKVGATARAAVRRLIDAATLDADVALVFREAMPLGPPLVERWIAARRPMVLDFDDAIFLGDVSDANSFLRPLKMPGKIATSIHLAAATTVGNEFLAQYARHYSQSVHVIPTTLDVERYRPAAYPKDGTPVVGWSGSPTTAKHLHTIDDAIRELTNDGGVGFHAFGAPEFHIEGASAVRASAWSKSEEVSVTQGFTIGVMPLPDDAWSRGKCGFKALLYMSLGVPVVASPVGVNSSIIEHGTNGFLAQGGTEWVSAIRTLLDDPDLRAHFSTAGRATVVERYSGQQWAPKFLQVLTEAASTRS